LTTILAYSANEIIEDAFLDSGIIPPDQIPEAEDIATGFRILNRKLKLWQVDMHLWKQEEGVLFLNAGQPSYFLGPTGAEACKFDDFIPTTTTAALSVLDTTITVTSTEGMIGNSVVVINDPLDPNFWTANADASIEFDDPNLKLTNTTGLGIGAADFDLTCVVGDTYRMTIGYVKGTTFSATFSAIDPITTDVLGTVSATEGVPNEVLVFDFIATQTTITFRWSMPDDTFSITTFLSSLTQTDLNPAETGENFIGIEQDDGTRHWTNILEVLTDTTLIIADGMTAASASGSTVFYYTTQLDRPLRIYNSRRKEFTPSTATEAVIEDIEIPLSDWARQEYMDQPLKNTPGTVNNIYYNPQLVNGRLYVWQTASSVNTILLFDYDKPFEVTPDTASEPDIPVEWANPLKWAIAAEMVTAYGVPPDRAQMIREMAYTTLEEAKGNSNQSVYDLLVSPDLYIST